MLSCAVAVLAAAVVCWPIRAGRRRIGASPAWPVTSVPGAAARRWLGRHVVALAVAGAAAAGGLLAGPGGVLAGAMAGATAALQWRAGRDRRARAAAGTGLVDALAMLVAELRAGAHPADAAKAAAADGHPGVGRALAAAAAAVRLGGDAPSVLRGVGPAQLRAPLGRLADAWSLADRQGIALADLLDTVRADTEHRVRFAAEVQARLAGPRATAAVLAGLPLLGLALGHAMGAAPLHVLGETVAGQLLLVVGTGLACAGVLWSARLASGVESP